MKKIKDLCQNCGKRKATTNWVGEGGVLAFTHGWYKRWCDKCCLEAQIAFAEKHKNDLRELKDKLKKLNKKEINPKKLIIKKTVNYIHGRKE